MHYSCKHLKSVTFILTCEYLQLTLLCVTSLELGAGGGLVGLSVAKGCKINGPLYITDQLEMYDLMQHNIALNGLTDRVKGVLLNW